jgi:hypothetical protein
MDMRIIDSFFPFFGSEASLERSRALDEAVYARPLLQIKRREICNFTATAAKVCIY